MKVQQSFFALFCFVTLLEICLACGNGYTRMSLETNRKRKDFDYFIEASSVPFATMVMFVRDIIERRKIFPPCKVKGFKIKLVQTDINKDRRFYMKSRVFLTPVVIPALIVYLVFIWLHPTIFSSIETNANFIEDGDCLRTHTWKLFVITCDVSNGIYPCILNS